MSKVWFITGCSSGLGRALAEEVLASGQRAVVSARRLDLLESFRSKYGDRVLGLALDVTDPEQVKAGVDKAVQHFGHIDVLVNNAGFGLFGAVEQVSLEEVRALFETNFFGLLNVTRAVLPLMRTQGRGHVFNMSSVGGFVSMPGLGMYNATKFAVEGLSEALAAEVAPFGIGVTIVEPGPFRTNFVGRTEGEEAKQSDYNEVVGQARQYLGKIDGRQPGDPARAAQAMMRVAELSRPPLRLPLGAVAVDRFRQKLSDLSRVLDDWDEVARGADFPS